jgi:hypothetical protein
MQDACPCRAFAPTVLKLITHNSTLASLKMRAPASNQFQTDGSQYLPPPLTRPKTQKNTKMETRIPRIRSN